MGEPGLAGLIAAAAAFVGSHIVLSGPLRQPLARALGQRAFIVAYSLVALAAFVTLILAFHGAPATEALWNGAALLP